MVRVAAYILKGNGRAERLVPLFATGIKLTDHVDIYSDKDFKEQHVLDYDAAIFWGYVETCQAIMQGFRSGGKSAVYLDLAYWDRGNYYKISVNSRHPTEYFQLRSHDDIRRKKFVPATQPYKYQGDYILVAGMGPKAAWAEKEEPLNSWETKAIKAIQAITNRPIRFRPKTTEAPPIEGTIYAPRESLEEALARAHAVVTHHSNVAVDGLIAGVPVFAWYGVASIMGLQDLSRIEKPYYPSYEDREQWLNDVAYCQWSMDELKNGKCWQHLKNEGLV